MPGLLFLFVALGFSTVHAEEHKAVHVSLIEKLLTNYSTLVRPAENYSIPTEVDISVVLHQILDVDVPNQLITTYVYVHVYWVDCFLNWDPAEYKGIKAIQLPANKIWRPDIAAYNSVNNLKTPVEMMLSRESVVEVRSNGTVWWSVPLLLTTNCPLNIDNFPFDRQACALQFGSWIHTTDTLIVRNRSNTALLDHIDFIANGEWNILGAPCASRVIPYSCCDHPHSDVICMIQIDRVPLFYIYTFLFPCLLLSLVAIFVFFLPPESGEKVTLSVTLLLAYILALQVIMTYLPTSASSIPIIEHYMGALCCLLSFSTVLSIIVSNFQHSIDSDRPPAWVRKVILDWVAGVLKMPRVTNVLDNYVTKTDTDGMGIEEPEMSGRKPKRNDTIYSTVKIINTSRHSRFLTSAEALYATQQAPANDLATETNNLLKALLREVRSYTKHYSNDTQDGVLDPVKEWVMVARVLDRVFLIIYLVFIVMVTIVMLAVAVGSNSPFDDDWMEGSRTSHFL